MYKHVSIYIYNEYICTVDIFWLKVNNISTRVLRYTNVIDYYDDGQTGKWDWDNNLYKKAFFYGNIHHYWKISIQKNKECSSKITSLVWMVTAFN